jgi:hypothetical protein
MPQGEAGGAEQRLPTSVCVSSLPFPVAFLYGYNTLQRYKKSISAPNIPTDYNNFSNITTVSKLLFPTFPFAEHDVFPKRIQCDP